MSAAENKALIRRFFEAIDKACPQGDADILPSPPGAGELRREVIVVLSDGDDTSSAVAFDKLLRLAKHSQTAIYTIRLDLEAPSSRVGRPRGKGPSAGLPKRPAVGCLRLDGRPICVPGPAGRHIRTRNGC